MPLTRYPHPRSALLLTAAGLLAGCEYIDDPTPVSRVEVVAVARPLVVGDSVQFRATALDARGEAMGDVRIAWASGAPDVLRVEQATGWARAIAPGRVVVVASARGRVDSAAVTILSPTAR
jgi:hypothetical protein